MHDFYKIAISAVSGMLAAFFGQYGLFFALVAVAVVLDVLTGLVKAKATGEGLSSEKARQGFWRKTALFIGLLFGIFLDYAAGAVLIQAGFHIGVDMPFALMVCAYIIINESISIAENIYLINPGSFPPGIAKYLAAAKEKMNDQGNGAESGEEENE